MTDPGYIHRIILCDSSGSMLSILDGMQSGFAEFTQSQREILAGDPGLRMTVSLWEFADDVECRHSFASLDEVAGWRLKPGGWTALHDGIGISLTTEGAHLASLREDRRPSQVSALIITDGKENKSRRYDAAQARSLVEQQRVTYNWDVTFLGANQDAALSAAEVGSVSSLSFQATNSATSGAMSAVSSRYARAAKAAASSAGGTVDWGSVDYTEDERRLAEGNS
jgi:hypothetical protein